VDVQRDMLHVHTKVTNFMGNEAVGCTAVKDEAARSFKTSVLTSLHSIIYHYENF